MKPHQIASKSLVKKAFACSFFIAAITTGGISQFDCIHNTYAAQAAPGILAGDDTVADIAAAAGPAVVNIEVPMEPPAAKPVVKGAPPSAFNEKIPSSRSGQKPGFLPKVVGSGLIIRPDGYIATNFHIVRHAGETIQVTLQDKRAFKAKIIGTDFYTDLAVLKIDAYNLHTIPFALGKKLRAGQWAIAIGNPFGYDHTVSLGIVSAVSRTLSEGSNRAELIQTDAAINSGNSGGPLLNIHGEVIGLTASQRGNAQNIAFAIPADVVEQVTTALIKNGTAAKPYVMEQPYLGFYMDDWDNRIINNPNFPKNARGVILQKVVCQSPGEKCGLKAGDFITKVGGIAISSVKEVRAVAKQHKPGDVLVIEGTHDGQNFVKKLVIGKYPQNELPN